MRANEFITEGVAGPKKCWPGHRKVGTQPGTGKNKGKRVNDCEKIKKKGVAEGYQFKGPFPFDVDHMPGPTIKRTQTGCKRCHGKGYVYKTPDGETHPMNRPDAKKYKCGKCAGIGFVKVSEQGVAEGLSKRDQKDVDAIKAVIASKEAELKQPNADRDAIQQSIAHEKKRLALYGQGVAEAQDSNFVGFMNKALGQKADTPTVKSPMPDFMKGAPVAGLDTMGYKAALNFGMKTLNKLTPTQKTKLAIKGEEGVVNWLTSQANKQGLIITDEDEEESQGKFMQEDLEEVQDFLPEVFKDPAIKSWAFVLTDGEPLPKAPVAGPFTVSINPGLPNDNGYANSDWKELDTLDNLPDAKELAQGLAKRNPKQFIGIWAANGKNAGFYWPGEGWRGLNEGVAEGNLHTLSRVVNGLLDTIDDNDNLPEWCQEKIAKAEMMLVSVWDYLQSQKERGIDPSISERLTPDQMFDIIEEMVENAAAEHGVDPELIWEEFESVDDVELFESAAWRRKEGKSKKGGLNAKGVASYRRENPGSKLQTAVTTKPSKLKKGSKAAKRRKSFCARMGGVKGPMKKPNGKPTRKALALRKWNC
jgi:hypothetical protein